MGLPCDNCIIDPICIDACPDFKDYISKSIISDFLSIYRYTPARTKRIYNLTRNNVEYFIYYSGLLKIKDKENKNAVSM